jgi:GET complex subunit GET2
VEIVDDDPAEVDISEHFYSPRTQPRPPSASSQGANPNDFVYDDAQLRQLMMNPLFSNTPPPGAFGTPNPGSASPMPGMPSIPSDMANDPMMQMLQQLMGGAGGPSSGNGGGGLPPGFPDLAAMMNNDGMGQQASLAYPHAHRWRILHVVSSILLAVYAVMATGWTWTGRRLDRIGSAGDQAEVSLSIDVVCTL